LSGSDYDYFTQHLPPSTSHEIFIDNVQSLIDQQVKISAANVRNQTSSGEDDSFLAHYHKYDEIIGFLKNVSDTYPDLVDLFSIGQTYEGRDIWGITIKSKKAREQPSSILSKAFNWATGKKPKHDKEMELIMHGGQHAREWVSVAVITYLIDTLTSKYGQDKHISKLVDTFSWTLIPVMNVDGYIYSHDQNRMVTFPIIGLNNVLTCTTPASQPGPAL
jgi:murein tripeptide amidase MpaA